jgi:hypothetical protein
MKIRIRKKMLALSLLLNFTTNTSAAQAATTPAVNAKELVAQSEKIRNPKVSHSSKVTVVDHLPGKKEDDTRVYESNANGHDAGLVKFITPASDLGKKLLIKADDMWVFIPTSANPIRISPRQKLTGNAAYGDIASIDYTLSYDPKFLRADKFEKYDAYVLELTAIKGKLVTYDKIEYWIDQKTKRPLKAHFMTDSGKVLRVCYYRDYKNIMGVERPTKLVIENYLNKGHETTLVFSDFKQMTFSSLAFKKENLGRD